MKKMLKRLCTGFLALATVVTALPTTLVHAESNGIINNYGVFATKIIARIYLKAYDCIWEKQEVLY